MTNTILFSLIVFFCLLAIFSSILMLVLRHPMKMALALVATMLNLAMVYGLSNAHVMAISQVLIYVGAVMIFMIYVVMLLDIRDSSIVRPLSRYMIGAVIVIAVTAFITINQMITTHSSSPMGGGPQHFPPVGDLLSFKNFAIHFLNEYWLHFELASVLLLVATVAAITILTLKNREA